MWSFYPNHYGHEVTPTKITRANLIRQMTLSQKFMSLKLIENMKSNKIAFTICNILATQLYQRDCCFNIPLTQILLLLTIHMYRRTDYAYGWKSKLGAEFVHVSSCSQRNKVKNQMRLIPLNQQRASSEAQENFALKRS